jgi:hypothetical protein
VLRLTAELNSSRDVMITVFVVELPAPMVSAPALKDSEKSAAGVTESVKVVL